MTETELQALKPGDVIGYDGIIQVIENDVSNRRIEVALIRKSMGKIAYADLVSAAKLTSNPPLEEEA
jgi:hypothetical protein